MGVNVALSETMKYERRISEQKRVFLQAMTFPIDGGVDPVALVGGSLTESHDLHCFPVLTVSTRCDFGRTIFTWTTLQ